jgi:hypothetical protein
VHHHTQTFLGNLHLHPLECWDCSYLPHPSLLLIHDTLVMLTCT